MGDDGLTRSFLPTFASSEVSISMLVGKGGFSNVNKLERIRLDEVYDTSEQGAQLRKGFAQSVKDSSSGYVIKKVRDDLCEEEHVKGIVDLAVEAEFLQVLSHPNIISMRAMANSDPHESRFFVVLDRLVITLDRKFNHWRRMVGENIGFWMGPFGYCCAKTHALHRCWLERILCARDIANALRYLHSQQIVYRDLKPDNLGFDAKGDLKLFDFGLAKRIQEAEKTMDDLYILTGNTGSLRYMAPEVANGEPYDQRVDCYSFGILFWQICSLTTPYAGYSMKTHAERVVRQGYRPKPDATWPLAWTDLMTSCWGPTSGRPDFVSVYGVLDEQVNDLMTDDGVVPSRASEIRAKKRKKKFNGDHLRLDTDTRITSGDGTSKRFDTPLV